MSMADWTEPDQHTTQLIRRGERRADIERKLDNDLYFAGFEWSFGFALGETKPYESNSTVRPRAKKWSQRRVTGRP
jgi:hypothetical protein